MRIVTDFVPQGRKVENQVYSGKERFMRPEGRFRNAVSGAYMEQAEIGSYRGKQVGDI